MRASASFTAASTSCSSTSASRGSLRACRCSASRRCCSRASTSSETRPFVGELDQVGLVGLKRAELALLALDLVSKDALALVGIAAHVVANLLLLESRQANRPVGDLDLVFDLGDREVAAGATGAGPARQARVPTRLTVFTAARVGVRPVLRQCVRLGRATTVVRRRRLGVRDVNPSPTIRWSVSRARRYNRNQRLLWALTSSTSAGYAMSAAAVAG